MPLNGPDPPVQVCANVVSLMLLKMPKEHAPQDAASPPAGTRQRATTKRKTWKTQLGSQEARAPYLVLAWLVDPHQHHGTRVIGVGSGLQLSRGAEAGDSKVVNLHDPLVSRRHAAVEVDNNGRATIVDLGSSNGTFVDGERVGDRTLLRDGAIISVGESVLCFRELSAKEVQALRADALSPVGQRPTLSAAMAVVCERIRALASTDLEVLFAGESGAGKEVCARALHALSGRRGPFVAINCASLPEALIESELFGFVKGAHSTATQAKAGLIEQADGGTLFLDEIGDMSSGAQAKLLRFLQDQLFTPLGSSSARRANTRIVAATRLAIVDAEEGKRGLRPDLAARLGPEPVVVPPLRERVEDLPALVAEFLGEHKIEPEALRQLFRYHWPANVRELVKTLQLAIALAQGKPIGPEHLPGKLRGQTDDVKPALDLAVADMIEARRRRPRPSATELFELLNVHQGDVSAVAKALGRQRTLVWRWLREYGHTSAGTPGLG